MKRNLILQYGLAAIMCVGAFSSCSQDDNPTAETVGQNTGQNVAPVMTVADLGAELHRYNANVLGMTRAAGTGDIGLPLNTAGKKAGVAMADVTGAVACSKWGWLGALLGAAVYSLAKVIDNALEPVSTHTPLIFPAGDVVTVRDSIGFFHNLIETELYNPAIAENITSSRVLISRANNLMRTKSLGYYQAGALKRQDMEKMAAEADAFKAADKNDLTFNDYCNDLTARYPEHADYLNFAADYLFVVHFGNVDINDYTDDVMFMINHANVDIEDATLLNNCIQIAYASSILQLDAQK